MSNPSHSIVVSNTTPLITLGEIGHLPLIQQIHQQLWIPQAVFVEYQAGMPQHPLRPDLTQFSWITIHQAPSDPAIPQTLDPGEVEAIALARANQARLVLIDEQRGRRIAVRLGLVVAGSLAILIEAKQRGFIPLLRPLLDEVVAQGRHIGPQLFAEALRLAGEADDDHP